MGRKTLEEYFGIFAPILALNLPGTEVTSIYEGYHGLLYGSLVEQYRDDILWMGDRLGSPGSRVLDLCSGLGRFSRAFAEIGHRITSVDNAPDMIKRAQASLSPGLEVEFIEADALTLDLERTFDNVVIGGLSYTTFLDPAAGTALLRSARRHLSPGGTLMFDYMPASGLEEQTESYFVFPMAGDQEKAFAVFGSLQDPARGVQLTNMYSEIVAPDGVTKRVLSAEKVTYTEEKTVLHQLAEVGFEVEEQADLTPKSPSGRKLPTVHMLRCTAV